MQSMRLKTFEIKNLLLNLQLYKTTLEDGTHMCFFLLMQYVPLAIRINLVALFK